MLQAPPFKWRFRQRIASQISAIIPLYSPKDIHQVLFPLTLTLLHDPVAEVRHGAFSGVSELLLASQPSYLSPYSSSASQNVSTPDADADAAAAAASDSERGEQDQTRDDFFFSNEVAGAINALTRSNGYMYRQTWAQLCRFLLTSLPRHVFERYFIQGILLLTSDPVFNVRLAVAQIFIGFDWLKTPSISAPA